MQNNSQGQAEEELLPIDIAFNKLLDWLIDRRHCDIKWQKDTLAVREKINSAIQDMPPVDEITELLSGSFINYFHCLRIVELLKISESSTKNIFGGYSSQRMKDWQEIVGLYEKNNLGLAEGAHLLIRNVNYEVPTLKRQIAKCQQTQRECSRKEAEYNSNASVFKDQYKAVCDKMGIKGDVIKQELMDLLSELPEIYSNVAMDTQKCSDIIDYYKGFVQFVSESYEVSKSDRSTQILPLLSFFLQYGNATVYQWRTGQIPTEIEGNITEKKEVTDLSLEEGIDWGDSGTAEKDSGGIDWGDGGADGIKVGEAGDSGGIDWGDSGANAISVGETGDSGGIDWGDGADDSGGIDWGVTGITVDDSSAITIEDSGEDGKAIAKGVDALTLLDNTETRNIFLDEMMELQTFLSQRVNELKKDSDIVAVNQFQSAPHIVQIQSKETVEKMASKIDNILLNMTSMRVQNLCLLKSSPRYVDRLADSLQQKLRISEKLKASSKSMVEKRSEAAELQRELEPKLEVIRSKTKALQSQISQEISKKYKNRPVHIIGEINSI